MMIGLAGLAIAAMRRQELEPYLSLSKYVALKGAVMLAALQAVLAAAFFFVFGFGHPSAATFTVVTGALVGGFTLPTGCNFKLDGDIQLGDLAKLASARAQVKQLIARRLGNDASMAEQWKANSPVLCLNSRGGNFAEGLRIAKLIGAARSTPPAICTSEVVSASMRLISSSPPSRMTRSILAETWPTSSSSPSGA